jgi:hypothetical protein
MRSNVVSQVSLAERLTRKKRVCAQAYKFRPTRASLYFFFKLMGQMTRRLPHFFTKTIDDVSSIIVQKKGWKNGAFVFSTQKITLNLFLTKSTRKHLGTLFNQSLTFKNATKKKPP